MQEDLDLPFLVNNGADKVELYRAMLAHVLWGAGNYCHDADNTENNQFLGQKKPWHPP